MNKTTTGLIAFGSVAFLAFCLLVIVLVAGNPQSQPSRGRSTASIDSTKSTQNYDDPYSPDCAIVRNWLRRNYGEVTITSWGSRTISRNTMLGDHATLSVFFRSKNAGKRMSAFFIIGPGDVVENVTVSE